MQIKVKIGAAVDGDLSKIIYEPMAAGLIRARGKAKTETAGMNSEALAATKSRLALERTLATQQNAHKLALERDAVRQKVREEERGIKQVRRAEQSAHQERERENKKILADAERDARDKARILAKAEQMADRHRAGEGRMLRGVAAGTVSTASGIVQRGVGVAADVARGAGVSFDIASGVKKRVDLEAMAANLVNSGHNESDKGIAGVRQDPRQVMADIQKTGETYGISQSDIGGALESFVGKTGELQTGREMLDAFAKTAKATGANIEDVASAAGAISNKLGDVPDKANAINKVMLAIAGQGKVGAVEIKDLATQMEKLTSQASKFKSNATLVGMTGTDTGANIAMLGVLAQAARKTEKGSAAQATQSAMAFVRDLTGQTAIKRIGASTIFADKGRTQLRDPQEIVKDIISKTKGDASKLSYMMSNQNSRAVVNSFMDPYMKAYGGTSGTEKEKDAAGRAAVDAAFQKLKEASLSDAAQNTAVAEAMRTTASRAEQFQQKLDRVVGDMADKLIPAMSQLADPTLKAAKGMSDLAVWAASNPLGATGAVMGAGLAKSMGDALSGKLTEAVIAKIGAANLGAAMIGTMVVASVGMMAIDQVMSEQKKGQNMAADEDAAALNAVTELKAAQRAYDERGADGVPTAEKVAALEQRLTDAKAKAEGVKARIEERMTAGIRMKEGDEGTGFVGASLNSLLGTDFFGTGENMVQREANIASSEKLGEMSKQLDMVRAAMEGVDKRLGTTLKVEVAGGLPTLPSNVTKPGG